MKDTESIVQAAHEAPAPTDSHSSGCTMWTAAQVAAITATPETTLPLLQLDPGARVAGMDLWDMWPVELADGTLASFAGDETLWMVLAAPNPAPGGPDPDERHLIARIHLMAERNVQWRLLDPVFPEGFTPGAREWSGSAVYDPATARVTVYFTASGRRHEASVTFEQRLFEAEAQLDAHDGHYTMQGWTGPAESVAPDGAWYLDTRSTGGGVGTIKAFRDPGFFRDPATACEYLFFTASCGRSASAWNGVVGVAERGGPYEGWQLQPPVLSADVLNNELERPHMRVMDGRYVLFWSTQSKVFADGGPVGPTGLYGAVADHPKGPFTLLNGTGLIAANPPEAPAQGYSWWVLADGRCNAFADLPGVADPASLAPGEARRTRFAGYPTRFVRVVVEGETARII